MNHTEELALAYKIRLALDQRTEGLDPAIPARLAAARQNALSHKKEAARAEIPVLASGTHGAAPSFRLNRSWLQRLGIAAPILAGLVLVVSLYQYEQQNHINAMADLDAAVLADELPLSAYTDHGFNAFLAKRGD